MNCASVDFPPFLCPDRLFPCICFPRAKVITWSSRVPPFPSSVFSFNRGAHIVFLFLFVVLQSTNLCWFLTLPSDDSSCEFVSEWCIPGSLMKSLFNVHLSSALPHVGGLYFCQECYKNSALFAQFLLSFITYVLLSYFVRLHCANIHTPLSFLSYLYDFQNMKTRHPDLFCVILNEEHLYDYSTSPGYPHTLDLDLHPLPPDEESLPCLGIQLYQGQPTGGLVSHPLHQTAPQPRIVCNSQGNHQRQIPPLIRRISPCPPTPTSEPPASH